MIELVFKLLYALIDITFDFLHAITPNINKYKERLNKRRLTQPAMPPKSNNNMFKKLINFIIDCFPSIKEYKEKRKKEKLEQKEWEQKIDEMMADYEPTSFDDETQFCVRPSDDEKEDDETCSWVFRTQMTTKMKKMMSHTFALRLQKKKIKNHITAMSDILCPIHSIA